MTSARGTATSTPGAAARMMAEMANRLGLNEDEAGGLRVPGGAPPAPCPTWRSSATSATTSSWRTSAAPSAACENLQRLYVLTYADMRAVAPGIWNNWRGTLVTELYRAHSSSSRRARSEAEDRAARARARTRAHGDRGGAGPRASGVRSSRFVTQMPDNYFLSTPGGDDRSATPSCVRPPDAGRSRERGAARDRDAGDRLSGVATSRNSPCAPGIAQGSSRWSRVCSRPSGMNIVRGAHRSRATTAIALRRVPRVARGRRRGRWTGIAGHGSRSSLRAVMSGGAGCRTLVRRRRRAGRRCSTRSAGP